MSYFNQQKDGLRDLSITWIIRVGVTRFNLRPSAPKARHHLMWLTQIDLYYLDTAMHKTE